MVPIFQDSYSYISRSGIKPAEAYSGRISAAVMPK